LVLAINGVPSTKKTPDEAAKLILDESTPTVKIVALNPTIANRCDGGRAQRWMKSAKRAGIAIGGGTMVGVGLIFIPTLPPPFREALIIGGVSVLGTEFEAPKHVMHSARDSLEKAVGQNETTTEEETNESNARVPLLEGQLTATDGNGSISRQSTSSIKYDDDTDGIGD
jgi:hypothetical protein